jgi:hypothetical protein
MRKKIKARRRRGKEWRKAVRIQKRRAKRRLQE